MPYTQCFTCGARILYNGNFAQFCQVCSQVQNQMAYHYLYNLTKKSSFSNYYGLSFAHMLADDFDGEEMPKATLSYEALQIDTEGNVTEGAYKLKLEGNFKRDIEPMVMFIKATIPGGNDRTYDPITKEWYYIEKWHSFVELALKGSRFTLNYTVTKEQFVELKRKQDEFARQAGQTFQVKQYDTNEDLAKFGILLTEASIPTKNYVSWSREIATSFWKKALKFFHPDLHPERAAQASELNEVWSRLKEGYYIK